jgi:hypothetical protein
MPIVSMRAQTSGLETGSKLSCSPAGGAGVDQRFGRHADGFVQAPDHTQAQWAAA